MIIAYYSKTGNVADFLDWYLIPALGEGYETKNIEEWDADESYVLVTPTYDDGEVPEEVLSWLDEFTLLEYMDDGGTFPYRHRDLIEGVIGSGNMNFGKYYGKAAEMVAGYCDTEILGKFELKGNPMVAEELAHKIQEVFI